MIDDFNSAGNQKILSINHLDKLHEINNILSKLISREDHLSKMEVLFFDALNIFRDNLHHPAMSSLLLELQKVQENEFKQVQDTHVSVNKRVVAIKRFKNSFRQVIRKAIRLE
jgi:hypothetical protein